MKVTIPPYEKPKKSSNLRIQRSKLERYAAWLAVDKKDVVGPDGGEFNFHDGHLDHIVPLAVGGLDDWENLLFIPAMWNLGKGKGVFSEATETRLRKLARDNAASIREMIADKSFSIPEEHATRYNLRKATLDEIFADVGATGTWGLDATKTLVTYWLAYGMKAIEWLMRFLGRTGQSIRAKISSVGLYNNDFYGQPDLRDGLEIIK